MSAAGDAPPRGASLRRRLAALAYEALLLAAMSIIVGFLFLPLVTPAASGESALRIPSPLARTLLLCALFAAAAAYCTWMWSEGRRTLPQKTWRLRIIATSGGPIGKERALVRYLAAWLGPVAALTGYAIARRSGLGGYALVLLALNYVYALVDRDRQFLHDRLAGTIVVRD